LYIAADGISPESIIMFRSFTDSVIGLKNEPWMDCQVMYCQRNLQASATEK